jgi:hypothetical protein
VARARISRGTILVWVPLGSGAALCAALFIARLVGAARCSFYLAAKGHGGGRLIRAEHRGQRHNQEIPRAGKMIFLLLLAFAGVTTPQDIDDGCVTTLTYSKLEMVTEAVDFCVYRCAKKCDKKSEEVCIQTPSTKCKAVGYADCTDTPTSTSQVRDDKTEETQFNPKICKETDEPKILVEKKLMPICEDITKEICDTVWSVDQETGEKIWAGEANCRNMTWNDCKLEEVEVKKEIPDFICEDGESFTFDKFINKTTEVTMHSTTCVPKVNVLCEATTEEQCVTVEWEDCTEEPPTEDCMKDVPFTEPKQEESHTLHCPYHFTDHINEIEEETTATTERPSQITINVEKEVTIDIDPSLTDAEVQDLIDEATAGATAGS